MNMEEEEKKKKGWLEWKDCCSRRKGGSSAVVVRGERYQVLFSRRPEAERGTGFYRHRSERKKKKK